MDQSLSMAGFRGPSSRSSTIGLKTYFPNLGLAIIGSIHGSGWWYTYPSEKYESCWDDYSQYMGKTCSKPPTRYGFRRRFSRPAWTIDWVLSEGDHPGPPRWGTPEGSRRNGRRLPSGLKMAKNMGRFYCESEGIPILLLNILNDVFRKILN